MAQKNLDVNMMQTRQHAPPARQPPPPPPPPRRSARRRPREQEEETQQQQQQQPQQEEEERRGGTLVSPRGQGAGRDDVGWEEVQHPPEGEVEVEQGQEREPLLRTNTQATETPVTRTDQGIQTDGDAAGATEGGRQSSSTRDDEERVVVRTEESTQTTPLATRGWILRVRVPISPPPPPTRHRRGPHDSAAAPATSPDTGRQHPRTGPVLGIHITPHMTVETLSACILQALLHHPLTAPDERQTLFFDRRDHLLVGLFCESNNMFVSLEHLLTTTNPSERTMEVYSPNLPPPPPPLPPPVVPWWYYLHNWLIILLPPLCGSFLYIYWNETCSFLLHSVEWWYNLVVHTPLAELYRYGPWFLGWEGDSLPSICSRITYHGDSSFWYRNLEECERIYAAKEEAWLRLARPFVWGVWMLLVVLIARFIVWELYSKPHPPTPPRPPPVDRDMVDLYRAWQVILRQVQRGQNYPTTNQQQQQQRSSSRGNTANYSQQPSARTQGSNGNY